jgi:hypothetical protein
VHPLVKDTEPPNTEPLPEARTQANNGAIYGRDEFDDSFLSEFFFPLDLCLKY